MLGGGTQDRMHCVARHALQPVAAHQSIDFHLPDRRLEHAASAEPGALPAALSECATPLPREDGLRPRPGLVAPVALVRHCGVVLVFTPLYIVAWQRPDQGMAILGMSWQRMGGEDQGVLQTGDYADLHPEFAAVVRLALGDALHRAGDAAHELVSGERIRLQEIPCRAPCTCWVRPLRGQPVANRWRSLPLPCRQPMPPPFSYWIR